MFTASLPPLMLSTLDCIQRERQKKGFFFSFSFSLLARRKSCSAGLCFACLLECLLAAAASMPEQKRGNSSSSSKQICRRLLLQDFLFLTAKRVSKIFLPFVSFPIITNINEENRGFSSKAKDGNLWILGQINTERFHPVCLLQRNPFGKKQQQECGLYYWASFLSVYILWNG